MKRKMSYIVFVLILGAILISPVLAESESQDDTDIVDIEEPIDKVVADKVKEKISKRDNIPKEQLEVTKIVNSKFELTNVELTDAKAVDIKSGKVHIITIDAKDIEVDRSKFEKQEKDAYKQKYGKSTRRLFNEMTKKGDTDVMNIGIWLSEKSPSSPSKGGTEDNLGKIATVQEPLVKEIKKIGGKIKYVSKYAPLVYASLTKKDIKEIEKRADIDVIDIEGIGHPEINSAVPTIRANQVWPYSKGLGVKVAVVEGDGIAFANPYIKDGSYYNSASPNIGSHATTIAGVIASTHATYKGVAPKVDLLSGNSQDWEEANLIAATDWALTQGVNVISLSFWLEPLDMYVNVMDRYYDYISINAPYPTVVKSAGNRGEDDGYVTSPGKGWNTIAVGAINDWDTKDWNLPNKDNMAPYSSYIDPISSHGDREKPEVAAVGGNILDDGTVESGIKSTNTGIPWITPSVSSGTSFAGPAVAGEAALLIAKNAYLKSWPEGVRAAIFASAVHNIEGSSRLSEKDGMGGVQAKEAYNIVANNQISFSYVYLADMPITKTFDVTAGKKVRVAISWSSKLPSGYGDDRLTADLDLLVRTPGGGPIRYSTSYDNNYEIVEFKAPTSGTYTVEIESARWDADSPFEWLGYAYSIR